MPALSFSYHYKRSHEIPFPTPAPAPAPAPAPKVFIQRILTFLSLLSLENKNLLVKLHSSDMLFYEYF
jgi:hypothetical protein